MAEQERRTHDVFLSYSTKDKTWADSACAVLEQHRIRCWIAPRDMTPGDEWGAGIIKGLNASRIMVLIFSDHANASKQVRKEVERAISKELTVLAFRIQDVEPRDAMEFNLSNIHWLDAFTPPVEAQLELLAASVKTHLGRDPGPPGPGGGPTIPTEARWPRTSWLIATAALFGLVVLAAFLMMSPSRDRENKTTPAAAPIRQAIGGSESDAHPTADIAETKPQTPASAPKLIPPAGPARKGQSAGACGASRAISWSKRILEWAESDLATRSGVTTT